MAKGDCADIKELYDAMKPLLGFDPMKSCNECSGDNCNTANVQSAGAWIALLTSAVTLSVAFNT